jgi:hemolysin type calcium-binding protein
MTTLARPLQRPRSSGHMRCPLSLLLAVAAVLLCASPAFGGALVSIADGALVFDGTIDQTEPANVTISRSGDVLQLDELGSRMTVREPCTAIADGYHVVCPATGVERIVARTSDMGSDVRVRVGLPAELHGGAGDDELFGGPADDTIAGDGGQDVLGGGGGADELRGGPDVDLVTYLDRVAGIGGTIAPRRDGGVRVAIGVTGGSGAPFEGDTIATDVEQVEGTPFADRFSLRDGQADAIACAEGRDVVVADQLDDPAIDCELTRVAPAAGGARISIPTLVFPFTNRDARGGGRVDVGPTLPLRHGALVVRVQCPVPIGLLDIDGPGCAGLVRFARDGAQLGVVRIRHIVRGRRITLRLPLHDSRRLARRASGLRVTVTALPALGSVRWSLRFTVRG